MYPLRTVLLIGAAALFVGGAAGRWIVPGSAISSAERHRAPSTSGTSGQISSRVENDPGTSRAISDVTPGRESGKNKPIPSVSELLRVTDYMKLFRDTARLADSLDQAGVVKALALVDAAPAGSGKSNLQYALVNRLAELDPKKALQYVEGLKPTERNNLYVGIASSWAAKDPAAAKAWGHAITR